MDPPLTGTQDAATVKKLRVDVHFADIAHQRRQHEVSGIALAETGVVCQAGRYDHRRQAGFIVMRRQFPRQSQQQPERPGQSHEAQAAQYFQHCTLPGQCLKRLMPLD